MLSYVFMCVAMFVCRYYSLKIVLEIFWRLEWYCPPGKMCFFILRRQRQSPSIILNQYQKLIGFENSLHCLFYSELFFFYSLSPLCLNPLWRGALSHLSLARLRIKSFSPLSLGDCQKALLYLLTSSHHLQN